MELKMSNKFLLTALALFLGANVARKGLLRLSVGISPVHSLVSKMIDGVGKPDSKFLAEASILLPYLYTETNHNRTSPFIDLCDLPR